MWKRNIVLILSTFVLVLFIIVVGILELIFSGNRYAEIPKENWDISLPKGYEQIYEKDSEPSFLGDGERYHIFRYKHAERVNHYIDWKDKKNILLEDEVSKVLSNLNLEEEYYPDFKQDYKYYFTNSDDSSKIYIIFVESESKIYVVEDIR
ncbi:MAG: hypothetical protein RR128_00655 [Clostridium sp.]